MREEEIIERAKDLYPKLLPLSTYICGYAYHDNDGTPKEIIQKYLAIGAEWARVQMPLPEDTLIFRKGVKEGKRLMMEEAVEGEVYKFGEIAYVKECNNAELTKYLSQFDNGDKVRIIILPKEEGE